MTFESGRKCLLLLACGLLIGTVAGAQTRPDPRSDAKVHVGPLYLTPAVAVREFGIDTNVFNNDENNRDFTFTIAPHADVWIPFARRALLTTSVTTDLVYYQQYSSERSFNPDVRVRGDVFLNRVTLFAEPSYLNTRQRPNFEVDARARRQERTTLAGVGIRAFPKVSIELAGREQRIDYDADAIYNETNLQQTLNRTTRSISATVRHELTPLTTLVLSADRGADRFEFSALRDADSISISPGVEFKPSALISGTAHVGFRRFTTLSDALPDFSGVVASATLNYTLKGSTRFTFNAERDTTFSYEALQPYFVVDGYGLTVRRQIVGRTDVMVGTQRYNYSYRDLLLPGAPLSDIDRVDRTTTWSTTFGYRIGRTARIGFGAIYRQRHSNIRRFRDYDGFRYTTTVDYGL